MPPASPPFPGCARSARTEVAASVEASAMTAVKAIPPARRRLRIRIVPILRFLWRASANGVPANRNRAAGRRNHHPRSRASDQSAGGFRTVRNCNDMCLKGEDPLPPGKTFAGRAVAGPPPAPPEPSTCRRLAIPRFARPSPNPLPASGAGGFMAASPPRRSAAHLHRSSFLLPFCSVRAAPASGRPALFRAYRMRARARVSAPARFARLIARANRLKAHFSCPFLWGFFAPARNEAASGCRFLLSHPTMDFGESSPHSGFISLLRKLIGQHRNEGVFGHALPLACAGRSRQGEAPEGRDTPDMS